MEVLKFKNGSRLIADMSDIVDILRQEEGFMDIADYIERHEKENNAVINSLNDEIDSLSDEISRLEEEIDILECA